MGTMMNTVFKLPPHPLATLELIVRNPGLFDDEVKPEILLLKLCFLNRHLTQESFAQLRDVVPRQTETKLARQLHCKDYDQFRDFVHTLIFEELDAMLAQRYPAFDYLLV